MPDGRQFLVTLNLAGREGGDSSPDESAAAVGVRLIAGAAVTSGYAPRRLRPRPVTLADEFYKLVEE